MSQDALDPIQAGLNLTGSPLPSPWDGANASAAAAEKVVEIAANVRPSGDEKGVFEGPGGDGKLADPEEAEGAGGLGDPGSPWEGGLEDPGDQWSSIKPPGSFVCSRGHLSSFVNLRRESEGQAPGAKYAKAEGGGGRGEIGSISGNDGGGGGGDEQIRSTLLGLDVLSPPVVTDDDDRTGRNCLSLQSLPKQEAGLLQFRAQQEAGPGDRREGEGMGNSTGADGFSGDDGGGDGENNHQSALLEKSLHDHGCQASRGNQKESTTSMHEQRSCAMLKPSGHRKSASYSSVRPTSDRHIPNRDNKTVQEGGKGKARCPRNLSDPDVPAEELRARNLDDRGGWGEPTINVTGAEVASGASQRRQHESLGFRAVLDDPLGLSLFRRRVVFHSTRQMRRDEMKFHDLDILVAERSRIHTNRTIWVVFFCRACSTRLLRICSQGGSS